jgi:hypothetical protein
VCTSFNMRVLVCKHLFLFLGFLETGDFYKKSKFLNVRQRKNLR